MTYKIYLMNKNFMRYSRGGMLLDLENQKNHYKQIIQPRKSMQINEESHKKLNLSLNQNNKYEKEMTKKRYQQNQRLFKALMFIKQSKGIIELMSERAKQEEKKHRKLTLVSQFRSSQIKKQMRSGNKRIVEKIGHVKPRIGNSIQWDDHYQNFEKQKKKISRATQNVFDIKTIITDRDGEIKDFLRQTIGIHRSRASKSSRKNKTMQKSRQKKNEQMNKQESVVSALNEQQVKIINQQGKNNEEYQNQKFEQMQQKKVQKQEQRKDGPSNQKA